MKPKIEHPTLKNFPYEELRGKEVMKEMDAVQEIMENTDLDWWFSAGTVLGLRREEGGYIAHDKDIDLEVLGIDKNTENKVLEAFKERGYELIKHMIVNDKNCQTAFINLTNNIIVDVYYYEKIGDELINENDMGTLKIPMKFINRIYYYMPKGMTKCYMTPYPLEEYLTYRYGDWETPRHNKVSWANDAGEALERWK